MDTYEVLTAKEKMTIMIRYDQVIIHREMLTISMGKGLKSSVKVD